MASSYKSAKLSRHLTQDVDNATDIITISVTISGINNVITTKISIQVNIATATTLYDSAKLSTEGTATPSSGFLPRTSNQLYCQLVEIRQTANCGKAEEKELPEKDLPAAEESEPAQLPPMAFRQVSHSAAGIFFRPDFLNRFHFHFLILGFFLVRGQFRIGLCNRFMICLANTLLNFYFF